MLKCFTEHPNSVGETYLEHMKNALHFAFSLLISGIACAIHAIFPFAFKTSASQQVIELYDRMVVNRSKSNDTKHVVELN